MLWGDVVVKSIVGQLMPSWGVCGSFTFPPFFLYCKVNFSFKFRELIYFFRVRVSFFPASQVVLASRFPWGGFSFHKSALVANGGWRLGGVLVRPVAAAAATLRTRLLGGSVGGAFALLWLY